MANEEKNLGLNDQLTASNKKIADAEVAVAKTTASAASAVEAAPIVAPVWWSTTSAMTMSSVVLLFGLLMTVLAANLLRKGRSHTAVLRVFGTILILVLSVFLVVAGYDDKQIAPVLGLLGTVAGYLLGSREDRVATADNSGPIPPAAPPPGDGPPPG